nr:MmcQ/YjbR family DNA-binding protein [Neisseria sp. oral taxon 014]
MNRTTLFDGLAERYGAAAEYPWAKSPDFAVFRHTGNRKWFCLYMPVPSEKLGMGEGSLTEIVNVKCRPEHIGA